MDIQSQYGAVLRACFFCMLGLAPAWCAEPSPAGLWKTIDDKTHQPRGIVRVYAENGLWFGKIVSSFNPADRSERCDKCGGERKDQPVIGMVIMRGMAQHGAEYSGGDILDPDTGRVYRCRFSLSADGQRLIVRGYFGISALGRSQVWIRDESTPAKASR
jgi:uncharacterized protein (DUF2147 family)